MDLVCEDFYDSESEREGVDEIYGYEGTTVEASDLDLFAIAVTV